MGSRPDLEAVEENLSQPYVKLKPDSRIIEPMAQSLYRLSIPLLKGYNYICEKPCRPRCQGCPSEIFYDFGQPKVGLSEGCFSSTSTWMSLSSTSSDVRCFCMALWYFCARVELTFQVLIVRTSTFFALHTLKLLSWVSLTLNSCLSKVKLLCEREYIFHVLNNLKLKKRFCQIIASLLQNPTPCHGLGWYSRPLNAEVRV